MSPYHSLVDTRKSLIIFLNVATRDFAFTFDNKFSTQIDIVAMGPLDPRYENAFLYHHKCHWLSNFPNNLKPIFHKRYIDHTFLLFKRHKLNNSCHIRMNNTWIQFDREIKFLIDYSNNNGCYLDNVLNKTLRSFLDNKLCSPTKMQTTAKETK